MVSTSSEESGFPIPASLQDLEREPYNLLPYPHDFDDDDEAARADSFSRLVEYVDQGNQVLVTEGISLFQHFEGQTVWLQHDRIQALYTLVRKSTSLSPATRRGLVSTLCQAVKTFSSILDEAQQADTSDASHSVVSQQFRDAFACHIYMLFSLMFSMESEAKGLKSGGSRRGKDATSHEVEEAVNLRAMCASAMLAASQSMGRNRNRLWKRGVPDESVVGLPCRIAYQMLESATGVIARKAASGDEALGMLAATVDSCDSLMGTVLAALMDMLHSYEHMAAICAELCCLVSSQRLGVELIREVGRLDTSGQTGGDGGKASGIKYVAPFIDELAQRRPRLVLANISHILPHLESEPYSLRSSIVASLGHIVEHVAKTVQSSNNEIQPVPEDEEEGSSGLNIEKSSGALLDILEARSHDVSSYTRAAVLKAWINLTLSGALPVERIHAATNLAIDRLHDKTVVVRKQALQLLTTLLENNPFTGDLDPEPYRQKLAELYNYVKENLPPHIKEAHQAAMEQAQENGDDETAIMELERATLAAAIAEADSMTGEEMSAEDTVYQSKVKALKFAQSALEFIDQYENASENLHGMLLSANTSDVTEALRFFVKARHFKLPCAITGMKQALTLMWSTEQNIKAEVMKAFVDVFIAVPGSEGSDYLPSDMIAYNLLTLANAATVSELASIEEAISNLVKEEKIPADVFTILWSVTAKGPSASRATAFHVIAMAASADKSIVDSKSRLKVLLDTALGDYTEEKRDWQVARAAAMALLRVDRAQVDESCAKYLVLERIMEQLSAIARGDWCIDSTERDTLEWFSTAEQVIAALFVISPEPEQSCADIIRGMHIKTLGGSGNIEECHPLRLARFFHVLGHIALKLLVYTEALSGSVRRATAKKTLKKQEEADKHKASGGDAADGDQIEDELGMAAEMEAENERRVAEIAEKEIVGRGLLSAFGPILVRVVANEGGKFDSEVLRQTSTLALCKFMCVSSSFCEKHLPVVFTALANAPADDVTLRANTVVALGDLAFRFPNEVEPYTPRVYACLRDSSTKVRRHTLMVLTHLILNDMVKVKGQVCEIAMCLRDDDQRIRDTARLLFHELSKRSNNPVYNLLPDIISQLSQINMGKDDFRGIMSFLLGYIKKDKQNEMLIEKLCQRFPKCSTIGQKADIAYCMAQLKVNERSVKWLVDNFKLYKDALFDEEVKRHFFALVSKAKKFAKPELKQVVEEWEKKLNTQAELGLENQRADEKAARTKVFASRRSRRKQQIETIQEWSEGEEEEDKENLENSVTPSHSSANTGKEILEDGRSGLSVVEA